MQTAKDSFYVALRNRLAALNPDRTLLLRGAVRPGILVEEAESPFPQPPADVFIVRWTGAAADVDLPAPLLALDCEIAYQTCGCQSFGGLDRGRALAQMDRELLAILQPFSTPKLNYSTNPPTPLLTSVFWDEPVFTPIVPQRDRLTRSARLTVYAHQEPGE